jgi:hypothetical protein
VADWREFRYRDFYDLPRAIVVEGPQEHLYLLSRFSEQADEYEDTFEIYSLPMTVDLSGSWVDLEHRATRRLGAVAVRSVAFDPSRRKLIDVSTLPVKGLF